MDAFIAFVAGRNALPDAAVRAALENGGPESAAARVQQLRAMATPRPPATAAATGPAPERADGTAPARTKKISTSSKA